MASPIGPGVSRTLNGITYWDEDCWEEYDVSGNKAFRILLCMWGDRFRLTAALQGANFIPGQSPTVAYYPDDHKMFLRGVKSKGADGKEGLSIGTNGMIAHKYARLTCEYGPATIPGLGGLGVGSYNPDLITIDFDIDVVTLPRNYLRWNIDTNPPSSATATPGSYSETPFPMLIPTARLVIPLSGLTTLNISTILSVVGHVNNKVIFGSPILRVMFPGARSKQRYLVSGQLVNDEELHFSVRSSNTAVPTWQQGFRAGYSGPQNFYERPYPEADLNVLFQAT